jgi:hypothetical protein
MAEDSVAATTTSQEDLVTARQSRINLIWEGTQAIIAIGITASIVYVSVNTIDAPDLKNAFFLVIGFYFSRTNHAAIGGIGSKPTQPYEGR